jgi:hypothetical protein
VHESVSPVSEYLLTAPCALSLLSSWRDAVREQVLNFVTLLAVDLVHYDIEPW